jgi:hypothetical protein
VLVGLLAAFLGMALASSRADLAQISERLDEARQALANGEFDAGREALRAAWVLPFFTKLTADHAQKLVPVIALIEAERAALGVDPQWTAVVAEARRLLELTGANGPYGFLSDELEVLNAVDSWLGDAEKAPDEDVLKKIAAGSAPAR